MQATINVHPDNQYAIFNGQVFSVKEIMSRLIAMDINGVTVDFTHDEVTIVDFDKEMEIATKSANTAAFYLATYNNLKSYQQKKNIKGK